MLVLLDIHQTILSAQAVLKCNADQINNVKIILKSNKLCISVCRNSLSRELNIAMPEDFLLPSTVSSVCCENSSDYNVEHTDNLAKLNFHISEFDQESSTEKSSKTLEILFRFQISNIGILKNCTIKNTSPIDIKNILFEKYKTVEISNIICTNCGSLLLKNNRKFKSIHKYYEGMSELAETSFCHKHGDDDHSSVEMNADTVYIGDLYFYFHYTLVNFFLVSEINKMYKCIKCSSILSFKKKMDNLHYIGFFSDKIMLVKSATEENDIKKYKLDTCLFSFSSIVEDLLQASVSSKMYLQSKVDETTEVLLLWINSQKIVQFLFDEVNEDNISYETELKGNEVFKVLYCVCLPDSDLSKKWKHNFSVEFFHISDNMMNVIKELLQKSSKYFPENQDTVKGFSFGYLPAYVSL